MSKNREGFVNDRVMKVREHNKKVIERKRVSTHHVPIAFNHIYRQVFNVLS